MTDHEPIQESPREPTEGPTRNPTIDPTQEPIKGAIQEPPERLTQETTEGPNQEPTECPTQESILGSSQDPLMEPSSHSRSDRIRNLTGFWLLGLCNNFGYVVMLSAAHDILTNITPPAENGTMPEPPENRSGKLIPDCNPVSTGAVLLADILPTLIVKLTAPFYVQGLPYWLKVAAVALFGLVSFPVVAISHTVWLNLLGVVLGSISCGLGELTFLALSSHFDKDVVSTWSSGTGGSGVFGALSYAGLLAAGLSTRNTLLLMMIIPTSLALAYYLLLVKPAALQVQRVTLQSPTEPTAGENTYLITRKRSYGSSTTWLGNFKHKLKLIVPLLPFMIPLGLVYFAEYFINQGLQELLYFDNIWLTVSEQYRWYQVLYQIGVFISRSSVNCMHIEKLWILPILQMLNVALLLLQVFFKFIPSIWIMFILILYEGLLGGLAYVNTFYGITKKVKEEDREYSMGVASVADSLGIAAAGVVALPVHDLICTL